VVGAIWLIGAGPTLAYCDLQNEMQLGEVVGLGGTGSNCANTAWLDC